MVNAKAVLRMYIYSDRKYILNSVVYAGNGYQADNMTPLPPPQLIAGY